MGELPPLYLVISGTHGTNILIMERVIEVGIYSLAWAAGIGGFIFGTMFAIYTITQKDYEK